MTFGSKGSHKRGTRGDRARAPYPRAGAIFSAHRNLSYSSAPTMDDGRRTA
jgi:hypothetical protein